MTEDGANEEAEHVQSSESGPESVANHIDSDTDESPLESLAESGVSDIDENSLVSSAESADTDENVPEFVAEPVGANVSVPGLAIEFLVSKIKYLGTVQVYEYLKSHVEQVFGKILCSFDAVWTRDLIFNDTKLLTQLKLPMIRF